MSYGAIMIAGAVPLGLCFVLAYLPPMVGGAWAIASILGAHLLFRTAYAAVNVPYLAMTARISADARRPGLRRRNAHAVRDRGRGRDRARTVPVGRWLTGLDRLAGLFRRGRRCSR